VILQLTQVIAVIQVQICDTSVDTGNSSNTGTDMFHIPAVMSALEALCDYALYKSTFTFTSQY